MAVPRVFLSSTYYDLKQVRNNIGTFIEGLGYEAVMHEHAGVAYTQIEPLETDCYRELSSCDIVVCIIGNHFGTKSAGNELSITMNELKTAIKNKKKIYIFISKDVYIENRTYVQNKENSAFKSAYADDNRIHEFICELKESVRNNPIEAFETTDEIVALLKLQFAGLFQNLLAREASLTEAKTAYDLQESADTMKKLISDFECEKDVFFSKFDSTMFASKMVLQKIRRFLGMNDASFFAKDDSALDEFMSILGFKSVDVDDPFDDHRKYVRETDEKNSTLILKTELFDKNGRITDIRDNKKIEPNIIWTEEEKDDDELPF